MKHSVMRFCANEVRVAEAARGAVGPPETLFSDRRLVSVLTQPANREIRDSQSEIAPICSAACGRTNETAKARVPTSTRVESDDAGVELLSFRRHIAPASPRASSVVTRGYCSSQSSDCAYRKPRTEGLSQDARIPRVRKGECTLAG